MSEPRKIAPTAVQVGDYVYLFESEDEANEFLACVLGNGLEYCDNLHQPRVMHIGDYVQGMAYCDAPERDAEAPENDDDDDYTLRM